MITRETIAPMSNFLFAEYVIVNPVNRKGAMGAGVAKWFRDAFPYMYEEYAHVCKGGKFAAGEVMLYTALNRHGEQYFVANVPSKHHWREKSDLALIIEGLNALDEYALRMNKTIVTTRIGCGLGGLSWTEMYIVLDVLYAPVIVATGKLPTDFSISERHRSYRMLKNA